MPVTCAALAAWLLAAPGAAGAGDRFLDDCRALCSGPHRLAGTAECLRASEYIESRLREIGLDEVIVQEFPTVGLELLRCELELTPPEGPARRLPLLPARPNGIVPPVTPPEGLSGEVLRVGPGGETEFPRPPQGRIVVLDYNSPMGWLAAFREGAKAVVFTRTAAPRSWHALHVEADANLPRFYYEGDPSDIPDGSRAVIRSEVAWTGAIGRNVFGLLRGKSPRFQMDLPEMIVLAAHIDSYGEVPHRSPGARAAANCAALLRIAERLRADPPARHVLFAFFDAQARGHAGSSAFYRVFEDTRSHAVHIENRLRSLANEQAFLAAMREALAGEEPLARPSPVRREILARLKVKADEHADAASEELYLLRKGERRDGTKALQDALGAELDRWNALRRALGRDRITEEVRRELSQAIAELRRDVAARGEELAFEARALGADKRLFDLLGSWWLSLHVSLVFGDSSERWGLSVGGDSHLHSDKDMPGLYAKLQKVFLTACERLAERPSRFEQSTADGTMTPPRVTFAAPWLVHSGEVGGRLGVYNLVLCTSQERLTREGTPADTLESLDARKIELQAEEAARVLAQVASEEGLSLRRSIIPDKNYFWPEFGSDHRVFGPLVMAKRRGSSIPNRPVAGALVRLALRRPATFGAQPRKPCAFDNFVVCRTNQNGSYAFGPIPADPYMDSLRGFAAEFDARGEVVSASDLASANKVNSRLNVFACRSGAAVLPPQIEAREVRVLDARANFPLEEDRSFSATTDGVVWWYCERKVQGVKLFRAESIAALVNGESSLREGESVSDDYAGKGLPLGPGWEFPETVRRAAADMWRLNAARMDLLRSRGVVDKSVQDLHGRAEDLLLAASAAGTVAESSALAASAFLAEVPVYERTRQTLDDLVHAVLVLLGLSVPFAFALERLLVGSTNIYRQVAYFAGFFVLTFVILYLSHPAFAISKTPMIIFLGFAVLVLSGLVIVVIMRRFEVELKVLQGLTTTVHSADVSRFNTMMAAMAMGISTMRRRPLRTALTATTIVLLTFTILCFASFGTKTGVVKLFLTSPPGYTGVMVRHVNWASLGLDVPELIRRMWSREATVAARVWTSPETEQSHGFLVARADGSRPVSMRGILGFEAAELARRRDLAELLGEPGADLENSVWLTQPVAKALSVSAGDEVMVSGARLRLAGVLEPGRVAELSDLDGSRILPVDFIEMKSTKVDTRVDELGAAMMSRQNWAALPTDSVAIVSASKALELGATVRAVMLYTDDAARAGALAEEIARLLPLPVAATRSDGVYRHFLGSIVEAGGAKDLLFPVILGGLVIFGTMLGSVADREKEIFTFSALGLAPPHVASLFLAESMVYSVVGGLGGYLLAQTSMKVLEYLASFGLVRVPEMNYSSTNAIVTLLIVMATVLASAVYPAIRASRSANPGILRTWRLPPPEGDDLTLVFPFTVSEYDITGVVSFLKEHFENLAEAGLGVFMARDVRLIKAGESLGLEAHLALAPFDLGVTQSFALTSTPSEIPGIDLVRIAIRRKSGQPKDWYRLNKVLLDDLRRQFLIWRALPHDTMDAYRHRTLAALAALQAGDA